MCDPLTIAAGVAAAATMGGGALQTARANSDQNRANEARSKTAQEELIRQKGFRGEAQAALSKAFTPATGAQRTQDFNSAVAARTAGAQALAPTLPSVMPSIGNAPAVVNRAFQTGQSGALADSQARAAALAKVFGQGDVNSGVNIGIGQSGSAINQLSGLAGVSNRLAGTEMDVNARNAMKGPSGFADLLSGVGDIGLMLALSGGMGGGAPNVSKYPSPQSLIAGFEKTKAPSRIW